jgi:4-hydroxyproline epimerase
LAPDLKRVHVIDSHTAGEPTRVVVHGAPDMGSASINDRLEIFRSKYDWFRSAVVNEPRGSDAVVGALLCEPSDPASTAAVIFFNNVGYLGMCGHGTIGLVATLAYMGRISPGEHRIETPAGTITARLHEDGAVTVHNVPSYRKSKALSIDVPGHGTIVGDIAWGGNWFFLVEQHQHELSLTNLEALTDFTWSIRQSLQRHGITGDHGQEIDHIELMGPPSAPGADKKNFVLCPGKAYDRSPCGTGTSAKLACLYADGKLKPGEIWHQESIVGTVFEGSIQLDGDKILPSIKGTAYINSEADLLLDPRDPFCMGIRQVDLHEAAARR